MFEKIEESGLRRGPKARVYLSYRVPGAGCEPSCMPTAWVTKLVVIDCCCRFLAALMRKMQPSTITPIWTCFKVFDLPGGRSQTGETSYIIRDIFQSYHDGCVQETN